MHQDVQHDIFRHPPGEVADRDADQRHPRQGRIRHQRVDPRAEIENHLKVREPGQFAGDRLPDRGIVNFGRIEIRGGLLQDVPVGANFVEPGLPPLRRPVFGPATHQYRQRAFTHCLSPVNLNVICTTYQIRWQA